MSGGPFHYAGAEDLLETHLARTSRGDRRIYGVVVLFVMGSLASLPTISVDVYVSAAGVIRPATEKHALTVGVDGIVESVSLEPASTVERDQVLVRIRARSTEARQEALAADLHRAESAIEDLDRLLSWPDDWASDPSGLQTIAYRQEARELAARLAEIDVRIEALRRDSRRLEVQVLAEVVTRVEAEERRFELRRTEAQRALLLEVARSRWADALSEERAKARALSAEREQLLQARALYEVRSPVRGSLDEVVSLSPGSFVRSGALLAVVSPDADLVAEVSVPPADMGFIRLGGRALLRVHAFNPQEWGVLNAKVTRIGGDIVDGAAGPVFRVRAALERDYVQLPGGQRGHLRKGMTFEARFLVARRSLYQLLRDRVQDWVVPPTIAD